MAEKHIRKIKTKNGFSLEVIIPINRKAKRFGTFKRSDYDSDRAVMAAAKECRDKALMDIRMNKVIQHDMTVQECYEKSLALFVNNIKTRKRHQNTYDQLFPEAFRTKQMSKVTAADLQTLVNDYAQNHSEDSLSRTKTLLKQMYRAALMSGIPLADQSQMIIMPKAKKPQAPHAKHCTLADFELFLEGLLDYNSHTAEGRKKSRDTYLALRVMQYIGIRPQEAFALYSEDIDLAHGVIYIRRSIGSTANSMRQVIATKTGESIRVLPIPDPLRPVLEEMLAHDTEPLLQDLDGLPYDTSKISNLLCHVAASKKVPHINQYMLRHMFGTDMTKKNVKLAQTMMGHESPKMTLNYANKASLEEMREALEKRYS